jgi:hypothetical protein
MRARREIKIRSAVNVREQGHKIKILSAVIIGEQDKTREDVVCCHCRRAGHNRKRYLDQANWR